MFDVAPVREKLACLERDVHAALTSPSPACVPRTPARDAQVLVTREHPPKKALTLKEGQARLLHDLASIELQATELGLRTLHEFSDAPAAFRRELADITLGEGRHLALCLDALDSLGFRWGDWPVHTGLWDCTSAGDSLIDRILIVHRYLEGSGLDAGDSIFRRLSGVDAPAVRQTMKIIVEEEVDHVLFGSRWYREACQIEGLEAADEFAPRMDRLQAVLPRRFEAVCRSLRKRAGFTEAELEYLERLRRSRLA